MIPRLLNCFIGMSTDSSKYDKHNIRKLQNEITIPKSEDKFKEYRINHLKAEISLLHDTLNKIKGASKEYLYKHEGRNETLNMQHENGYNMTQNGDEIHYAGENNPAFGIELKRKHWL